jgi:hypothetical protein
MFRALGKILFTIVFMFAISTPCIAQSDFPYSFGLSPKPLNKECYTSSINDIRKGKNTSAKLSANELKAISLSIEAMVFDIPLDKFSRWAAMNQPQEVTDSMRVISLDTKTRKIFEKLAEVITIKCQEE